METSQHRYLKWLRYSGAVLSLRLNPWHWLLRPEIRRESINEWAGPSERTWTVSWLFLTVRVWIDNGDW